MLAVLTIMHPTLPTEHQRWRTPHTITMTATMITITAIPTDTWDIATFTGSTVTPGTIIYMA